MSLVPYPDIGKLPEEARDALAQAPVQLNIFKMMANAETCYLPFSQLGAAIFGAAEAGRQVARTGDPAGS